MSACCLTVYAKSPGFAIFGFGRSETDFFVGILSQKAAGLNIPDQNYCGETVELLVYRLIPEGNLIQDRCRLLGEWRRESDTLALKVTLAPAIDKCHLQLLTNHWRPTLICRGI